MSIPSKLSIVSFPFLIASLLVRPQMSLLHNGKQTTLSLSKDYAVLNEHWCKDVADAASRLNEIWNVGRVAQKKRTQKPW